MNPCVLVSLDPASQPIGLELLEKISDAEWTFLFPSYIRVERETTQRFIQTQKCRPVNDIRRSPVHI